MYIETIDSMNFTRANYTWTIKATAKGGRTFYSDFQSEVFYDCKWDNITYLSSIPANDRASDMKMLNISPVTYVRGEIPGFETYELNIASLFTNNASAFCLIVKYRISKVQNSSTGQDINVAEYSQHMSIEETLGLWSLFNLQ